MNLRDAFGSFPAPRRRRANPCRRALLLIVLSVASVAASGEPRAWWPQFRGPHGGGVAAVHGDFPILARNDLDESLLATPAIVDRSIYVRTTKALHAFAERSPAATSDRINE